MGITGLIAGNQSAAVAAVRKIGSPGLSAPILRPDLDEQQYIDAFLSYGEFGKGRLGEDIARQGWGIFTDVTGRRLVISDAVFRDKADNLKIGEKERRRFVLLFAATIQNPDKIYETWYPNNRKDSLHRNYVAEWQVEVDGREINSLAVFEQGKDGWFGVTTFDPREKNYAELRARRRGQRIREVYSMY